MSPDYNCEEIANLTTNCIKNASKLQLDIPEKQHMHELHQQQDAPCKPCASILCDFHCGQYSNLGLVIGGSVTAMVILTIILLIIIHKKRTKNPRKHASLEQLEDPFITPLSINLSVELERKSSRSLSKSSFESTSRRKNESFPISSMKNTNSPIRRTEKFLFPDVRNLGETRGMTNYDLNMKANHANDSSINKIDINTPAINNDNTVVTQETPLLESRETFCKQSVPRCDYKRRTKMQVVPIPGQERVDIILRDRTSQDSMDADFEREGKSAEADMDIGGKFEGMVAKVDMNKKLIVPEIVISKE